MSERIKKGSRRFLVCLAGILLMLGSLSGCTEEGAALIGEIINEAVHEAGTQENSETQQQSSVAQGDVSGTTSQQTDIPDEYESYYTTEDVALYLYCYDHLPENYITKKEAQELGWDSSKGNLWEVAEGMCIGGDKFGNYEGLLPEEDGRKYYECDVNYEGGYRGAERIIFSNDGLIYYTGDHYQSFELLYGEE